MWEFSFQCGNVEEKSIITSSLSPFSWEEKGSVGSLSTPLLSGEGPGVR